MVILPVMLQVKHGISARKGPRESCWFSLNHSTRLGKVGKFSGSLKNLKTFANLFQWQPLFDRGNPLSLRALCFLGLRLFWYLWVNSASLGQPLRSGPASVSSIALVQQGNTWAEVKMGLCCDRIGLCRPSSASVTWTSSNNEGDLTHNSSSKVLRDLYMMLLSQCSLELLLVPPTLIHSHRAWPRKELVHVSPDTILKINKNEWKIAEEVIF